eukprot:7419527-Ditylum_brightwellii.AAC.1
MALLVIFASGNGYASCNQLLGRREKVGKVLGLVVGSGGVPLLRSNSMTMEMLVIGFGGGDEFVTVCLVADVNYLMTADVAEEGLIGNKNNKGKADIAIIILPSTFTPPPPPPPPPLA